jgi:hypothetical protein
MHGEKGTLRVRGKTSAAADDIHLHIEKSIVGTVDGEPRWTLGSRIAGRYKVSTDISRLSNYRTSIFLVLRYPPTPQHEI